MIGNRQVFKISMLVIMLILVFSCTVFATPNATLSIDSLEIEENTTTNLNFEIDNSSNSKILGIVGIENFKVLSQNTFNSSVYNNGNTSSKKGYNYVIMPIKSGEFQLQGIIEEDGKQYNTNILKITVTPESVKSKENASNLFLETNLSKDTIYMGEKTILSYDFYSMYSIEGFAFTENLAFDNFIAKNISKDQPSYKYTNINGTKYIQYDASTNILSPTKEGTFDIPSFKFQANVISNNFFNSSTPQYMQTDSKKIIVKPLPLENKPKDFSGLVGSLEITSNYNKTKVDLGDSLTLNVTASGDCNLEKLSNIIEGDLPDFSVYQTEKNFTESTANRKYSTKKEFEIILIPKKAGQFEVKPISINYFDPSTKKYETAAIQGANIEVIGDVEQNISNSTNNATNTNTPVTNTKIKINTVDYNPPNENLFTITINKNYMIIFTFSIIILVVLILGFILFRKKVKIGDKKLQGIYLKLKNTNDENDLYNILNEMIKHSFNLSLKSSSKSEIISRLPNEKILAMVLDIVEYIENKKYSQNKESKDIKVIIEEIYKLITHYRR